MRRIVSGGSRSVLGGWCSVLRRGLRISGTSSDGGGGGRWRRITTDVYWKATTYLSHNRNLRCLSVTLRMSCMQLCFR